MRRELRRWTPTRALLVLVVAGVRAADAFAWELGVNAQGDLAASRSIDSSGSTFYSPQHWSSASVDPELLVFNAPELEFGAVSDLDLRSMECPGGAPSAEELRHAESSQGVTGESLPSAAVPPAPTPLSCNGVSFDKIRWKAYLRRGVLHMVRAAGEGGRKHPLFRVSWLNTTVLRTQSSTRGRGMELSELVRFRHLLLAMCDITGLAWKIRLEDGAVFQRFAIADGNGEVSKPFKIEWATRKNDLLVVGSVGKSYMDPETGEFYDRNSEWIKTLDTRGGIHNADWGHVYSALRTAANVSGPGYLWHEAVEWDALSQRWLFLPRKRGLRSAYHPERDETMGTNVLLLADERFQTIVARTVGPLEPEFGFSALRRVPGQRDAFMALKVKEVGDEVRTVRPTV